MLEQLIVTFGAGLAGMLLFVVSAKGSVAAIFATYFAPLPIAIAALGWSLPVGLAAALLGAFLISVLFHPLLGAIYAASFALPICWLAYLGSSSRKPRARRVSEPEAGAAGRSDWYPIGTLVAWAAAIAAAIVAAGAVALTLGAGGIEAAARSAAAEIAPGVDALMGSVAPLPAGLEPDDLAALVVHILPFAVAGFLTFVLLFNLWLAGRVVAISKRLDRPWPRLPENLMLPRAVGFVLAAALATALTLNGYPGLLGSIVAGAFATAVALQGLAAIHALTRGFGARPIILIAVYATLAAVPPWPMMALATFGLADLAFRFRGRKPAASSPPPRM